MPSYSSLMLFPLILTAVFIATSTSLVTYNFNQPIQLLRLLKMDPRRQMALIRLSESALQRYEQQYGDSYNINQADSAQQQQQPLQPRKIRIVGQLPTAAKKWDASAKMNWPTMLMVYEMKP